MIAEQLEMFAEHPISVKQWVSEFGGAIRLAEAMNVTRQIVYLWVEGSVFPGITNLEKLMKLAGGKLTIVDFYKNYSEFQTARKQK